MEEELQPRNIHVMVRLLLLGTLLPACATTSPAPAANTSAPAGSTAYQMQWLSNCTLQVVFTSNSDLAGPMVNWGDGSGDQITITNWDSTREYKVQHDYLSDGKYIIHMLLKRTDAIVLLDEQVPATVSGCSTTPALPQAPTPTPQAACVSQFSFQKGDALFTSPDPPGFLYLHTQPSNSAELTSGKLYGPDSWDIGPAIPVYVRDGPVCAEGLVWWKVQDYFDISKTGWTPEAEIGLPLMYECGSQDPCKAAIGEAGPPAGGVNP